MKWYETWDARTHKPYWWTQRDVNGVCFEIHKGDDGMRLYKCGTFISKHATLQNAMDAAQMRTGSIHRDPRRHARRNHPQN